MSFPPRESLADVLCNCGLCNLWTNVFSSRPELTLLSLASPAPRAVLRVPFHGGQKMCFVEFAWVCDYFFRSLAFGKFDGGPYKQ